MNVAESPQSRFKQQWESQYPESQLAYLYLSLGIDLRRPIAFIGPGDFTAVNALWVAHQRTFGQRFSPQQTHLAFIETPGLIDNLPVAYNGTQVLETNYDDPAALPAIEQFLDEVHAETIIMRDGNLMHSEQTQQEVTDLMLWSRSTGKAMLYTVSEQDFDPTFDANMSALGIPRFDHLMPKQHGEADAFIYLADQSK